ncbi:4'-phosphopantetheinyl transferase superfamily protein [Streptomyces sp. NPDC005393]|uniref:4'-phosphopantetheinyl transferase family protein n=1 Tax=Streptomyces sp. NPDC005393 TaxID=3157041 RepID=UPI0033B94E3C
MGTQPGWDPDTVAVWWSVADGDERRKAHTVAVRAAARLRGVAASGIRVAHQAGGRPFLDGAARGLQVSLSHGRGVWAVALGGSSRFELGVDVEVVRPLPALGLARRYLAAAEARWLAGLGPVERETAFMWLWTQKEAVGKALGLGLRGGGMSRPVPVPAVWPPAGAGEAPPLAGLPLDPDTASAAVLTGGGRYVVGVAVHGPGGAAAARVRVCRAEPVDEGG